ncbi:Peptide chain release factor class I/class II [Niveomyces insectorum RCEF 264]|uniref:Peptide chain release factor class I/class II n=1 Tax=Niveomyces insectorum RCEF 264 TaxID=1081102 RepID=A0A167S2D7_9HYPO|nr:Peptide chain release factor class I/class II [Niveomyces insectorum RCEF 264]
MLGGLFRKPARPLFAGPHSRVLAATLVTTRPGSRRYQAFDTGLDPDDVAAARQWRQAFEPAVLPQGSTTFSRSSGPGGQHVNKTESKATTAWPVAELLGVVPKLLHAALRSSRYYAKTNDSLVLQAQTQRSRGANADQNRRKLYEELLRMYEATVPGEASPETRDKYEAVEKAFHANRIREKKKQGSKKQSRRGGGFEG